MQNVLHQFRENLNQIDFHSSRFLLAVSGGIDSMVLSELFLKCELNFSIAHCNFRLRGIDSEADEAFVKNYCVENQIEFFSKKFNVKEYKQSGNYSTQMAARDLRYNWFRELMRENEIDFLVTAHHLNDSLETFLINLSRGTGINGLTGIQFQQNKIIRPLYNLSKESIVEFAQSNHINWREDVSNAGDNYTRNKIRHQIVPVLNEIHPEFLSNFGKTIRQLNEDKELIKKHTECIAQEIFHPNENGFSVSIESLNNLLSLHSYLFHLFSGYGFMHPSEIQKLMTAKEGSEIISADYRLIKNREQFILSKKIKIESSEEFIIEEGKLIQKPLNLKLLKSDERDLSATETVDYEKISFPLRLRKQKTGDVFFPFGMKGSKKISKFFKDEKLTKIDKENSWLLVDNDDKIIYSIGKRIDDRFKITEHTQKFLNIYLC